MESLTNKVTNVYGLATVYQREQIVQGHEEFGNVKYLGICFIIRCILHEHIHSGERCFVCGLST